MLSGVKKLPNGLFEVKQIPGRRFFKDGKTTEVSLRALKHGDVFWWSDAGSSDPKKTDVKVGDSPLMSIVVVFEDYVYAAQQAKAPHGA